ncbi:MAG: thymidine kinase [Lachnospiraceae bacterium]|nr:thymidine kinase [Lachnospiraceae bacterium]
MAKLYFYYGAMGASKTAQALMTKFNYEEKGQKALLVKADLDTRDDRDGKHLIRSRVGLESEGGLLGEFCDNYQEILKEQYDVIIVDEAQFATREQVDILCEVVDSYNIPVVAYGLRSDFQGNLFTGSEALLAYADQILEIKTMCWCGKKATMNARFNENGIIKEGDQIVMGANSNYTALCRKHWRQGQLHP